MINLDVKFHFTRAENHFANTGDAFGKNGIIRVKKKSASY